MMAKNSRAERNFLVGRGWVKIGRLEWVALRAMTTQSGAAFSGERSRKKDSSKLPEMTW